MEKVLFWEGRDGHRLEYRRELLHIFMMAYFHFALAKNFLIHQRRISPPVLAWEQNSWFFTCMSAKHFHMALDELLAWCGIYKARQVNVSARQCSKAWNIPRMKSHDGLCKHSEELFTPEKSASSSRCGRGWCGDCTTGRYAWRVAW